MDDLLDDVPELQDGLTRHQRRILTSLARKTGSRRGQTIRSDLLLADMFGGPVPSLERALVAGERSAERDPYLAAYRALVELAQPFTTRYPLVIGTGNFGSIDGDPPVDAVFTRCSLSSLGTAAAAGLVPHLLINGAAGRAGERGFRWLPHHLGDVLTAVAALIEHPALTDEELAASLPGPDFPTGGVVVSRSAAHHIYLTGEGRLPVRGRAEPARLDGRPAVVVTELPFTVAPGAFAAELTDGMCAGRLPLADVIDERGPHGVRIVLPLRAGVAPGAALEALFAQTRLQIALPVDMVALVDGAPRRVSLPVLLRAFVRSLADRVSAAGARAATPATLLAELDALRAHVDARRTTVPPLDA
jgi:DNA gyrase subunit A